MIVLINLNIQRILNEKKKTRYWLVKALDSNYETINRLCDNASSAIYLETIEKLCRALECEPNDLFMIE
ncbi:MAG: helix-turn-helix transcriptional regulator [Firmicutes bacterium]|nr:helix-turn-helix transcriptional regulator [Bacillota bacterium]